MDAVTTEHLVCYCNTTWGSILPPPPCPYHSVPAGHGTMPQYGWFIPAYSPWTHIITVTQGDRTQRNRVI